MGLVLDEVLLEVIGEVLPSSRALGEKKALTRAAVETRSIPVANEYPSSSSSSMMRKDASRG